MRDQSTPVIAIFEGSLAMTPFINRLVTGLARSYKIHVLGFKKGKYSPIKGINYWHLGSSAKPVALFWLSLWYAFRSLTGPRGLHVFLKYLKLLLRWDTRGLKKENLIVALHLADPDILHIQWPSLLDWCQGLTRHNRPLLVLSQRGYQVNIRPFVDAGELARLREWYPKIAGIHSVSRNISLMGDEIYNNVHKIDRVIYSGFELTQLPFNESYGIDSPVAFLSVGRPHWKKGYDLAIRACALLKKAAIDFSYTIVGAAGDEELLYLIDSLGLSDTVRLLPKVPQEEVYKMMSEAHLLVLSSLEEGIANVVIEAMAVGTPILSTDCGGMPELIIPGETGWLVKAGDAAALAKGVTDFLNTPPDQIEQIRLQARKKVEEQHSMEQMVEGMEALYREVVKVGSRKSSVGG